MDSRLRGNDSAMYRQDVSLVIQAEPDELAGRLGWDYVLSFPRRRESKSVTGSRVIPVKPVPKCLYWGTGIQEASNEVLAA